MEDDFERASHNPSTLSVPGLPTGCPLLTSWSGPQQLTLFPRPTEETQQWAGLTHVSWDAALWNGVTRRLANQSHGYFMALHEAGREGELSGSDLLHYSRYYRSALHECVLGLESEQQRQSSSSDELEKQIQIFSTLALVWHLMEILYIEVLPAGCLVKQLIEWVCWAGQTREKEKLKDIISHTPPENHPTYWRMMYRLVVTGRLTEAHNLLAHHSSYTTRHELFSGIDQLLQKAPMVRPLTSMSKGEQQNSWEQWRREVIARRDAGNFLSLPQLDFLSRILSGEEDAFKHPEVLGSCESWYEVMVGRLLYTTPLVVAKDYDLVYSAEMALKEYEVTAGPLDSLLLAALKQNPLEVVSLASSELSNWWLAAHLAHLMQQRNLLHQTPEYGAKLTEFLIVEYASSLLSHQSLWQLAMDYFSECPTQGRQYMAIHLERVPLTSSRKAAKVLNLCHKFQLKEQGDTVCRVMAIREFKSGRLGAALSWCLQNKDINFTAYLAERYFMHYQTLGEFMDLDLLDHLGAAMLISRKLTFLGKYREFHRLFNEKRYRSAGQLLVSLLHSEVVPKRFWMTLLMDALHLLDSKDQVIFSSEETITLSHCLQQLTSSHQSNHSDKSHDSQTTPTNKKLDLLRVALCRNLSLAMLEEAGKT